MRGVRWSADGVVGDEVAEPGGSGVVVDVVAASICGTDLHFMRQSPERVILGHEFAGLVDGVPYAVEAFRVAQDRRSGALKVVLAP